MSAGGGMAVPSVSAPVRRRKANLIDAHVGSQVRRFRLLAELSQEELGRRVGVSFQQIQKYEKGKNRISAGRLYQIATIVDVYIGAFFEGQQYRGSD